MNKNAWIATAALCVAAALPSTASAHGQYLEGVNEFVGNQFDEPPCPLPGMTCGLCHQPVAGDPEIDITVGFMGIETTIRNRSFYEGLTGPGGWMHSMHMAGMGHIDTNRMMLLDDVLPNHLDYDGDGDLVPDLEELSLGFNPLVAYDEMDPAISQLCDQAAPWPDVGGTSGTTTEGDSTSTGDDPTSGGESTTGDDPTTTDDPTTGDPTNTTPGMPDTGSVDTGGTGTGGSGAADDGGDDGGCSCTTGSGNRAGFLGLLMLGLVAAGRRRRA